MNDDNFEDPCKKHEGHLQLKITKLREFAREKEGQRRSEPVQVLGLPWEIVAISKEIRRSFERSGCSISEQWLAFQLQCNGYSTDPPWACTASATFKVLAQKEGKQDHVREVSHLLKATEKECGFVQFMRFETLMDPDYGWYDEIDDSIVLSVDFTADALRGISLIAKPDVLSVNGKKVKVNKHHLACYSSYFERFFFGKEYKENAELVLLELPATVDLFERMLDTMHPQNRQLDDDCIEGVYHLANQFLLTGVEEKCRQFLYEKSEHSAIFKYRLADKYDFPTLKKQILASSKENFSKEGDFFENVREYAKLNEKARQALNTRFGQLFGNNFFAQGTGEARGSSIEAGTDLKWR